MICIFPAIPIPGSQSRSNSLLHSPIVFSIILLRLGCLLNYYLLSQLLTPHFRFFFHEHARKIGIWAWAFVISPYLGPFLSAIISNYKPWRTSFWIDFLIVGLALTFVTFLGSSSCPLDIRSSSFPSLSWHLSLCLFSCRETFGPSGSFQPICWILPEGYWFQAMKHFTIVTTSISNLPNLKASSYLPLNTPNWIA
jgi:MFS family permease